MSTQFKKSDNILRSGFSYTLLDWYLDHKLIHKNYFTKEEYHNLYKNLIDKFDINILGVRSGVTFYTNSTGTNDWYISLTVTRGKYQLVVHTKIQDHTIWKDQISLDAYLLPLYRNMSNGFYTFMPTSALVKGAGKEFLPWYGDQITLASLIGITRHMVISLKVIPRKSSGEG